mgnify:CR=1 FL=1
MNFHEKLNNFIKKEKFEWGISDSEIPVFQRVYFGKNGKIEHYEFKVHNEFITKEKENEFDLSIINDDLDLAKKESLYIVKKFLSKWIKI